MRKLRAAPVPHSLDVDLSTVPAEGATTMGGFSDALATLLRPEGAGGVLSAVMRLRDHGLRTPRSARDE